MIPTWSSLGCPKTRTFELTGSPPFGRCFLAAHIFFLLSCLSRLWAKPLYHCWKSVQYSTLFAIGVFRFWETVPQHRRLCQIPWWVLGHVGHSSKYIWPPTVIGSSWFSHHGSPWPDKWVACTHLHDIRLRLVMAILCHPELELEKESKVLIGKNMKLYKVREAIRGSLFSSQYARCTWYSLNVDVDANKLVIATEHIDSMRKYWQKNWVKIFHS